MIQHMAKLDLPPHCQVKKRDKGKYYDVYFMPHPKDRPDGWPATIKLGRTDKNDTASITAKAEQTYNDYILFKDRLITGEDIRLPEGSIPDVIQRYKESPYWSDLSERTRYDYDIFLTNIHDWSARAGHPHIKLLSTKAIVKWLQNWDETPRRQKYARTVISIVFSSAIREGFIEANPVKDIKLRRRKADTKKKIHIWTQEDVDRFVKECDARGMHSLGTMILLGIETAQRKADVLKMMHGTHYQAGKLSYKQQKTGKLVQFDATDKLKARLEKYPSGQLYLLVYETTGKLWDSDYAAKKTREICDHIGLEDYVFAHLRHSQTSYLFELGLDANIIRAITGHSESSLNQTLDNVYLEVRNEALANKGVAKINEVRQKNQTEGQTK